MRSRVAPGEVALALLFAAVGIVWIVGALALPLWEGFAPNMGFMPLIYGCLLVGLSAAAIASLVLTGQGEVQRPPVGKPILLLAALTAAIIGMATAGFGLSIFLMLSFMHGVVERRPVLASLLVAAGTTVILILIFATWLGVPLPRGPWGF
ncbi:MAG: tripartite tricarboxylate transporter TctB family protein [Burkholderiales bacterium]